MDPPRSPSPNSSDPYEKIKQTQELLSKIMMASLVPNVSGMSPSMPQSQLLSYQMAQIQMLQQMAYMQKLAQEHSQNSRPEESPQSPLDLSSQFSMFKPQESNHHQAEEILKTFPHLAHLGYGGLPGLSGLPTTRAHQVAIPKTPSPSSPSRSPPGPNAKLSGWQSQWLKRSSVEEQEVFKCSTCQGSFPSFQRLTDHMVQSGHFATESSSSFASSSSQRSASPKKSRASSDFQPKRDILKEPLPMPRKLVRGQDVWLGRGAEQTKNILKCMYCQESFPSLEILTSHMKETGHYAKVISQDQITSWKGPPPRNSESHSKSSPRHELNEVQSVLTCRVCQEPFSTLKDLGEHMLRTNHQDPATSMSLARSMKRDFADFPGQRSGSTSSNQGSKRQKSLPVKTLLELERSKRDVTSSPGGKNGSTTRSPLSSPGSPSPIGAGVDSESISRPLSTKSASSSVSTESAALSQVKPASKKSSLGSLEDLIQAKFHSVLKQGQSTPVANISKSTPMVEDRGVSPPRHAKSPPKESPGSDPLAALQLLCQDSSTKTTKELAPRTTQDSGSILAFSWACNEALARSGDSHLIQCPYCDTTFASKGAYRHHLSKVHFTKDDQLPPSRNHKKTPDSLASSSPQPHDESLGEKPKEEANEEDGGEPKEGSQNKYQKYTEMAKQLSSQANTKPLSSPA